MQRREPFLAWPGWDHVRESVCLFLAVTLWFVLIYGGADRLTAQRDFRVAVHFNAELKLPFVPEMVVCYMSIYLLFLSAPFILRTRQQLRALAITLAVVTFVGGICFLLLPAELAFLPPPDAGKWSTLVQFADWLNLEYNLLPSLHVALSVVCVAAFTGHANTLGRIILWCWAVAISVSTLLTHQHHLADVITGFILGMLATRYVYRRLAPYELES
jgi:membrane-associated phospholipid phosphatase